MHDGWLGWAFGVIMVVMVTVLTVKQSWDFVKNTELTCIKVYNQFDGSLKGENGVSLSFPLGAPNASTSTL